LSPRLRAQVTIDLLADIRYKPVLPPCACETEIGGVRFWWTSPQETFADTFVRRRRKLSQRIQYPPGYYISWAGQFQYLQAAKERLKIVIPFTLLIIIRAPLLNTKSVVKTESCYSAVPFSLSALLGCFLSSVQHGVRGLGLTHRVAGLDAEPVVVMCATSITHGKIPW